jgi:tRNA-dependent cyclodipeptide synthase
MNLNATRKIDVKVWGQLLPETNPKPLTGEQCFIGVSLTNSSFYGDKLFSVLEWIGTRFSRCLIVVGDYLHRHNEEIFRGDDGLSSTHTAMELGDSFLGFAQPYLDRFPSGQFQVLRWRELIQTEQYIEARAMLDEMFLRDERFAGVINSMAADYITRQIRKNRELKVDYATACALSATYLLEEIAVFSALAENGWNVEIYPGKELSVLKDIIAGEYPNAPTALKRRISIELHLHSMKQS